MALATFFDKTALAAAAVLREFDRAAFDEHLLKQNIALVFDDAAANSFEARIAIELSANLLARLYPRVTVVALGSRAEALAVSVEGILKNINSQIETSIGVDFAATISAAIVVGETTSPESWTPIHIGSDRWITRVSSRTKQPCGNSGVPFGAAAAACFGAAHVFRRIFEDQLGSGAPDENFQLSVLDMTPNSDEPLNPQHFNSHIGSIHLVGVGAIGNGFLWSLNRTVGVTGEVHAIDRETIQLSNLQRYLLATSGDVGLSKTQLAVREDGNRGGGLKIIGHAKSWGEFLAELPRPWKLERVAVALDSAVDRIAAQACLPRWIVNAWTQPGDLGVSRHPDLISKACLACLYFPNGPIQSENELVANATGLVGQEVAVSKLLYTNEPVGTVIIEKIAAALGVPVEPLLVYADRPLREFYSEAVCGGVILGLQTSPQTGSPDGDRSTAHRGGGLEAPMAFQSALSGILMAAAVISHVSGFKQIEDTKTIIDLLKPLGSELNVPIAKHSSGRCLCQDPDFLKQYHQKWKTMSNTWKE